MTRKRLDELIGRLEPRMARRFRQVMQRVRSQRTLAQLEAALEGGTIGTLLDDIEGAAKKLASQSGAARALVAGEVSEYLGKNLDRLVSFDGSNPRAVAALARNRLDLIQGLTATQRDAIGEALRLGHQLGLNPRQTARAIRDSIGLTAEQTGWVANYRRALERNSRKALGYELRDARSDKAVEAAIQRGVPLSQERIDQLVNRYRRGVLVYRSETIARTESIRNAHEAHDEAYQQAIDDGHVHESRIQQKWHTGPRSRWWHNTMNGQLRKWGSPFKSGQGTPLRRPGDPDAGASECANCNCGRSVRVLPEGQVAINSDDGAASATAPGASSPAAPHSETTPIAPAPLPGRLATATLDRKALGRAFPGDGSFDVPEQRALRAHLASVAVGYGLYFSDGARALHYRVGVQSVDAMGFSGGFHGWKGEIIVSDDQFELLAGFNREAAAGTDFAAEFLDPATAPERIGELHAQAEAYRLMLHESVHGHGPDAMDAFSGAGLAMEEAITEVVARRMTRDALGLDLETISTWGPDGPNYAEFIGPMRDAVGSILSLGPADAYRTLEAAALKFKATRKRLTSPEDAVDRFLDGIDLASYDADGQSLIRRSLRNYFLAVWPTPAA